MVIVFSFSFHFRTFHVLVLILKFSNVKAEVLHSGGFNIKPVQIQIIKRFDDKSESSKMLIIVLKLTAFYIQDAYHTQQEIFSPCLTAQLLLNRKKQSKICSELYGQLLFVGDGTVKQALS